MLLSISYWKKDMKESRNREHSTGRPWCRATGAVTATAITSTAFHVYKPCHDDCVPTKAIYMGFHEKTTSWTANGIAESGAERREAA